MDYIDIKNIIDILETVEHYRHLEDVYQIQEKQNKKLLSVINLVSNKVLTLEREIRERDNIISQYRAKLDQLECLAEDQHHIYKERQKIKQFIGEIGHVIKKFYNPTNTVIGDCCICLSCPAEMILTRCGHLVLCESCSVNMQSRSRDERVECPVCRKNSKIRKVFGTTKEEVITNILPHRNDLEQLREEIGIIPKVKEPKLLSIPDIRLKTGFQLFIEDKTTKENFYKRIDTGMVHVARLPNLPKVTNPEQMKIIRTLWRELTDEKKNQWDDAADAYNRDVESMISCLKMEFSD